jgi:hypothetical protein
MLLEHAIELVEFLESEGHEAELYENYSGRCMYGNTTTGVTTDARPCIMKDLEEEMETAGIEPDMRSDSMGLDYIYY